MAKSMNKDNLEEILKLHGNIAKERNEKLINGCVERMMTILAKSGRQEDLIKQCETEYKNYLKDGKYEKGENADKFKAEMDNFFGIVDQSSQGAAGGKFSTKLDVKVSPRTINNPNYGVDEGPVSNVTLHQEQSAREIMALKQQVEKLQKECKVSYIPKHEADKLLNENKSLKKEYDVLNKKAGEQLKIIQNFESTVNEYYIKQVDLTEQVKHHENVFGKVSAELDQLQKQNQLLRTALKNNQQHCEGITNERMKVEKEYEDAIKYLKRKKAEHEETIKNETRKHADEMKKILTERDDLRDRFSKLAGSKLTDQNPDIADLSDPNRAMKLSERFGQLYDDEWTNAFEALTDMKMETKNAIKTLLQMLGNTWNFCKSRSEFQMESLNNVFLHPIQDISKATVDPRHNSGAMKDIPRIDSKSEKTIRKLRRELGTKPSIINEIKQAFQAETTSWYKENKYSSKVIEACMPYLQSCAEICWLMVLHDPPLFVQLDVKQGDKVDQNLYSVYSTSGEKISYLVWPALFNCKDGGLLSKGVVEPVRTVKKGK